MAKEIKKFLPCGYHDVERIETFLNDMSKEGLNIQKEGIFMNIVYFERSNERLYYHLVPRFQKTKEENAFKDEMDQKGYVYIDTIVDYYIFAHNKPFMILDCDNAYKALKKKEPGKIWSTLLSIILFISFDINNTLLLTSINIKTPIFILVCVMYLTFFIRCVFHHLYILEICKKYEMQEPREEKDWHSTKMISPIYYYTKAILVLAVGIYMFASMDTKSTQLTNIHKEEIAMNTSSNLFITLEDFETEEMKYTQDTYNSFIGGYRKYSDLLSPINYEWEETGDFSPGENNYAILYIDYHQTIHEILASELVKEYRYLNLHHDHYDYEEVSVNHEKYNFDELYVLEEGEHRVYIIRKGKDVICFDLLWRNDMHQIGYVLDKISQNN